MIAEPITDPRIAEATAHIESVHGNAEGGHAVLWAEAAGSSCFDVSEPGWIRRAAETAVTINATESVYLSVNLLAAPVPNYERGTKDHVGTFTGLVVDIDVDPGNPAKPATISEAVAFLESELTLTPTRIIASGTGAHGYFLLHEPFAIASDDERAEITSLGDSWKQHVEHRAANRGWTVDKVFDLTRVLSIPGMVNRKAKYGANPPEIHTLHECDDRYSLGDIWDVLPEVVANTETPNAPDEGCAGLNDVQIADLRNVIVPIWTAGQKHFAALYVGGLLANNGIAEAGTIAVVDACSRQAGDSDTAEKIRSARGAYKMLRAGRRPCGWTGLKDLATPDQLVALSKVLKAINASPINLTLMGVGLPDTRVTDVTDVTPPRGDEGAKILDAVFEFCGRFIAYPSLDAHVAHTLWIAHTHNMDAWDSTPRLAALSPEPGSGKTRVLEVTDLLVPNPVEAVNVSSAYLFRKVDSDEGRPTILFDEIDTVFGPKAGDHEDIRALLNAGHRKGAVAGRCVVRGKNVETVDFPAYCAVALAGLGNLPDTILSRSIVIQMRRRSADEKVQAFRRRVYESEGHKLRDRLAVWSKQIEKYVTNLWPVMPAGIEDRDADVWEALIAVADAAGGEWPNRARHAAVAMVEASKQSTPSLGIRLLVDIQSVFGDRSSMSTNQLLKTLINLEESPWSEHLRGKPLNPRALAQRLGQYGVKSKTIREGDSTAKGYTREDLADAWDRYIPKSPPVATESNDLGPSPIESVTSVTPSHEPPPKLATLFPDAEVIGDAVAY